MDVGPPNLIAPDALPVLLLKRADGAAQCATWRLASGEEAVALFLDAAAADAYRTAAGLDAAWQSEQLPPQPLAALLEWAMGQGISHAVLNPTGERALRLFALEPVVAAARQQFDGGEQAEKQA